MWRIDQSASGARRGPPKTFSQAAPPGPRSLAGKLASKKTKSAPSTRPCLTISQRQIRISHSRADQSSRVGHRRTGQGSRVVVLRRRAPRQRRTYSGPTQISSARARALPVTEATRTGTRDTLGRRRRWLSATTQSHSSCPSCQSTKVQKAGPCRVVRISKRTPLSPRIHLGNRWANKPRTLAGSERFQTHH